MNDFHFPLQNMNLPTKSAPAPGYYSGNQDSGSANGGSSSNRKIDDQKSTSSAKRSLPGDGSTDAGSDAGDIAGDAPSGGGGNDALDEFDDLTIEELRSLLDNFKNLSKTEQLDLIQYMKKLEATNPDKVKMLRQKK